MVHVCPFAVMCWSIYRLHFVVVMGTNLSGDQGEPVQDTCLM